MGSASGKGDGGPAPDPRIRELLLPGDTDRSMPIMLVRAREAFMSHFKPGLAAAGISEQQWRVIRVLREESGLEAHVVAARAAVLPPSLTRITNSLEGRGILERHTSLTDRRRLYLSITPKGIRLMDELVADAKEAYFELIERFGLDRFEMLFQLLSDMAKLGAKEPK